MSSLVPNVRSSRYQTNFEVYVSKPDFKFNAAHFVAYKGFRERLHGHNYTVGVRLLGSRHLSSDGYVLDFGDVKKVVKVICKRLNERFLCPTESDVIDIQIVDVDPQNVSDDPKTKNVIQLTEDGSQFVFPLDDCAMLPIVHATVEELSIYMWGEIIRALDSSFLLKRGIHTMEVIVAEAPGQEAVFRYEIPEEATHFDIPSFIKGEEIDIVPQPCFEKHDDNNNNNKKTDCECSPLSKFSKQLEQLAAALNEKPRSGDITADDLRSMLEKTNDK